MCPLMKEFAYISSNSSLNAQEGVAVVFPAERRQEVIRALQQDRTLSVRDLSKKLSVSQATIRRDLMDLERFGRVVRSHGGASLVGSGLAVEPPLLNRRREHQAEKSEIAAAALDLIGDGDAVALDVGTTTFELAKALRRRSGLTIFTNSIPAAEILSGTAHAVYLIGGQLRHQEFSLVGALTRDLVRRFKFDVFFLGVAGFHLASGFSDYSVEDVEIKQAFMASARRTVALVDSSKWGRASLAGVAELSEVDTVVTDRRVDFRLLKEAQRHGLNVVVAAPGSLDEEVGAE